MIFFEKITKCIAFARDVRYTVTRIAPATCRFCALLPKQLTPRQGTKTPCIQSNCYCTQRNNLHPVRGRKLTRFNIFLYRIKKQLTPRQGTKTVRPAPIEHPFHETTYTPSGDENSTTIAANTINAKQLTPRQGTKTACRIHIHRDTFSETTYTPSGDENSLIKSFASFS